MSHIFNRANKIKARPNALISESGADWNRQVSDAVSGRNKMAWGMYISLGLLAGSGIYNIYQAGQIKVQVVHVTHESTGGVISVQVASNKTRLPTEIMLKAALERWVKDARTVSVDNIDMHNRIFDAYNLIGDKISNQQLTDFYHSKESTFGPQLSFDEAKKEVVTLKNVTAIPPADFSVIEHNRQTWRIEWIEEIRGRDGMLISNSRWECNVILDIADDFSSVAQATANPNGIKIISFNWSQV